MGGGVEAAAKRVIKRIGCCVPSRVSMTLVLLPHCSDSRGGVSKAFASSQARDRLYSGGAIHLSSLVLSRYCRMKSFWKGPNSEIVCVTSKYAWKSVGVVLEVSFYFGRKTENIISKRVAVSRSLLYPRFPSLNFSCLVRTIFGKKSKCFLLAFSKHGFLFGY